MTTSNLTIMFSLQTHSSAARAHSAHQATMHRADTQQDADSLLESMSLFDSRQTRPGMSSSYRVRKEKLSYSPDSGNPILGRACAHPYGDDRTSRFRVRIVPISPDHDSHISLESMHRRGEAAASAAAAEANRFCETGYVSSAIAPGCTSQFARHDIRCNGREGVTSAAAPQASVHGKTGISGAVGKHQQRLSEGNSIAFNIEGNAFCDSEFSTAAGWSQGRVNEADSFVGLNKSRGLVSRGNVGVSLGGARVAGTQVGALLVRSENLLARAARLLPEEEGPLEDW